MLSSERDAAIGGSFSEEMNPVDSGKRCKEEGLVNAGFGFSKRDHCMSAVRILQLGPYLCSAYYRLVVLGKTRTNGQRGSRNKAGLAHSCIHAEVGKRVDADAVPRSFCPERSDFGRVVAVIGQ